MLGSARGARRFMQVQAAQCEGSPKTTPLLDREEIVGVASRGFVCPLEPHMLCEIAALPGVLTSQDELPRLRVNTVEGSAACSGGLVRQYLPKHRGVCSRARDVGTGNRLART